MQTFPWDFHEDLTRDRLQQVAKSLRDSRAATLLLHDQAGGDTAWSLGCRIYARSAENLIRMAETHWPWMKIIKPPLEFIFTVGIVPVRFFHGDAENPAEDVLKIAHEEQRQGELAFGQPYVDLIWRIAVETNFVGETQRVILVGMTPAGEARCRYEIPNLDATVTIFDRLRPIAKSPVILKAPEVRSRKKPEAKKEGDDGGK